MPRVAYTKEEREYLQMLGKKITRLREQRGITMDRLALESGLSRATIYGIEEGKIASTTITLRRIAEALQIKVRQFFDFQ